MYYEILELESSYSIDKICHFGVFYKDGGSDKSGGKDNGTDKNGGTDKPGNQPSFFSKQPKLMDDDILTSDDLETKINFTDNLSKDTTIKVK